MVVFSLGYSHPIEYPLPGGIEATVDPKQTKSQRHRYRSTRRSVRWRPKCAACRPPDPFKNKGVRYAGERLKKKKLEETVSEIVSVVRSSVVSLTIEDR